MAGNNEQKLSGKLAQQYCREYPSVPNLTLARMLYRDNPKVYSHVEHARTLIRGYRGANGETARNYKTKAGSLVERLEIPRADPPAWEPYTLPDGIKRWLILADTHIPYHDEQALAVALEFGIKAKCDGVILLGDVIDCGAYHISDFNKDPRTRDMAGEVEATGRFLDSLAKHLKPKRIVWKCGNHEFRLERYLMVKAPELFVGFADLFTFARFLEFERRGITWVNAQSPIRQGWLTLLHGHEWQGGTQSPVNPARGAFLKALECTMTGHQHRSSEHTERTLSGVTITNWSAGCLCDLHPDYRPLNRWNHGFAVLHAGNNWTLENHRIVNGAVV